MRGNSQQSRSVGLSSDGGGPPERPTPVVRALSAYAAGVDALRHGVARHVRMKLVPGGEGWSLVSPDGESVFAACTKHARRRCLEFARAQGVLAVLS